MSSVPDWTLNLCNTRPCPAEERADELYGDVFDLLMTLSSFDAFKELMLSYKAVGLSKSVSA
jgi:hypothetical protein